MTMRRVAQALDTGAASLYAYVADKDELIEMVVERVIGEVRLPGPPDPERWLEQLKAYARAIRRVWAGHRTSLVPRLPGSRWSERTSRERGDARA